MVIQFENGQPKCFLLETPGLWKWEKRSTIHRQKFIDLHEYAKAHPTEIKEVNGVRVCCSKEFLIGKGRDSTRVYLGLAKDGVEKAVKRLPKDACSCSAEQEMKTITMPERTEDWKAVESCHPEAITDDGKCNVRYKKKSDIQVFFVND